MAVTKISIALVAMCGVAGAQPQPDQPATVEPTPTFVAPPAAPPPPPPVPTALPVATPAPAPAPLEPVDNDRPDELAFAIGLGYERPQGGTFDLQQPNIASARLRLVSGLTFEPTVTITTATLNTDDGMGNTTQESISEFSLGTLVRYPLIRHRRVDFEMVGSFNFDVSKDDPPGDFNTKTATTLTLGWGIGIGYWLSRHWQISATATNPLVTYTSTSQDVSQTATMSTSNTTIGITFEPTIAFMLHLYN
jgi:hypothetical protein